MGPRLLGSSPRLDCRAQIRGRLDGTVKLVNLGGRAGLWLGDGVADVERRSAGRFGSDPMEALARWGEFSDWASGLPADAVDGPVDIGSLGPCVPRPRAVFAIGLNYRDHAAEAGLDIPSTPMVFTKFPSCLAGPRADLPLTSDRVDWEVELVVVIGARTQRVAPAEVRDRLAGCCVGQDFSDRGLQFAGRPPQFSLGKSATAFGPIGPALVGIGDIPDPDDLALSCRVNDEVMQESRTSEMIFGVAELVSYLSRTCVLEPGDLVFTGTPAGVGSVRQPRRYLEEGDVVTSRIEGLGELENRCVASEDA